jgi:hypothetical protein
MIASSKDERSINEMEGFVVGQFGEEGEHYFATQPVFPVPDSFTYNVVPAPPFVLV